MKLWTFWTIFGTSSRNTYARINAHMHTHIFIHANTSSNSVGFLSTFHFAGRRTIFVLRWWQWRRRRRRWWWCSVLHTFSVQHNILAASLLLSSFRSFVRTLFPLFHLTSSYGRFDCVRFLLQLFIYLFICCFLCHINRWILPYHTLIHSLFHLFILIPISIRMPYALCLMLVPIKILNLISVPFIRTYATPSPSIPSFSWLDA